MTQEPIALPDFEFTDNSHDQSENIYTMGITEHYYKLAFPAYSLQ